MIVQIASSQKWVSRRELDELEFAYTSEIPTPERLGWVIARLELGADRLVSSYEWVWPFGDITAYHRVTRVRILLKRIHPMGYKHMIRAWCEIIGRERR